MAFEPTHIQAAQVIVQFFGVIGALYGLRVAIGIQFSKMISDYSDKYKNAVLGLPHEYIVGDFDKSIYDYDDDNQRQIILSSVRLFSVFSEEYELQKRHIFIGQKVWELWKNGNRKNMRFKMLREAWDKVKFRYHSDFVAWMENEIIAKSEFSKDGWM